MQADVRVRARARMRKACSTQEVPGQRRKEELGRRKEIESPDKATTVHRE